jgi:hypothetical protein
LVAALGMKNSDGTYVGFWGAMSNESRTFVHGLISLQEDYILRVLKLMLMQLHRKDGLNR